VLRRLPKQEQLQKPLRSELMRWLLLSSGMSFNAQRLTACAEISGYNKAKKTPNRSASYGLCSKLYGLFQQNI
jgi:hypothetical protein